MKRIPELLVPAGTYEKMDFALAYGADAVYAGIPKFSLRARENDFNPQTLEKAISSVRLKGKKLYLTMNIFPHNRKLTSFEKTLDTVAEINPDGLIVADPGMIMYAREKHPDLNIHLSTQSNTVNWMTVKFWHDIGVKRIILSRELTIDEIKEIRQKVPDIELETFIHGAICMAYSGRCLLSNYFNHRDANQGVCTNACRWEYKLYASNEDQEKAEDKDKTEVVNKSGNANEPPGDEYYLPHKGQQYYLEETERPGTLMPIDEDEHGTYIMNAKDLNTINILPALIDSGIDSLKVEGRTKSVYYVSTITRAYRKALDLLAKDLPIPDALSQEVYAVSNRGYVTGFLEKNPREKGQNYEAGHSDSQTHIFVGIVRNWDNQKGFAKIQVRNRIEVGDNLEMMTPRETIPFILDHIYDTDRNELNVAHGGGIDILIRLPKTPPSHTLLRKSLKDTYSKPQSPRR
jgi:putative protease